MNDPLPPRCVRRACTASSLRRPSKADFGLGLKRRGGAVLELLRPAPRESTDARLADHHVLRALGLYAMSHSGYAHAGCLDVGVTRIVLFVRRFRRTIRAAAWYRRSLLTFFFDGAREHRGAAIDSIVMSRQPEGKNVSSNASARCPWRSTCIAPRTTMTDRAQLWRRCGTLSAGAVARAARHAPGSALERAGVPVEFRRDAAEACVRNCSRKQIEGLCGGVDRMGRAPDRRVITSLSSTSR